MLHAEGSELGIACFTFGKFAQPDGCLIDQILSLSSNLELSLTNLMNLADSALHQTPDRTSSQTNLSCGELSRLEERNVRKGFLRDDAYTGLATECAREGLWLRAFLAVAHNFGWRKTELLGLRVHQIDLASRTIRLEVGETKNDDGRTIKMTDEVFTLRGACVSGKQPDDYVFTRADGKPVRDFRKAWRNACKRAGVPELLLHDLRRTGVRNLRRLGVAESVAMKISGHKTASIFRRYDITDEADLADAARRLDEKRNAQAQADISHSSAIVEPSNPPIVEGVNVN